jgi:iron complex outermembrane recepter protein
MMRSVLNKPAYIVATALGLGIATPGIAETPQSSPSAASQSDDLAEIVVTARRVEERLQDVPISITVLSEDAITKRDIYNAGDLSAYVPSLSSNANFGPQKSSFAIRGFTQEGKTSPSVAVYFADVVAPRANGGTTSGNGAGPGSLFDLQNVQVLKGPQGTLFGRNTTGGAILLVPAKPTGELGGSVEVSGGDYNMHRFQGVLNAPLNDMIRVRAAFDSNHREGYLINTSGIGPSRFGNTDYFAGRLSVVADLAPNLENYTIGSYSRSHDNGVVPTLQVCNNGTIPGVAAPSGLTGLLGPLACAQIAQQKASGTGYYDVQNTDTHPYENVDQWQVINTTTWAATDTLTAKNIISYAEYREAASFSLWGTNFQLPVSATFHVPIPTIQLDPGPSGRNSAQSTFTEELQLRGSWNNERLTWQAGGYLEISDPIGFSSGAAAIFLNCTDTATYNCTNPLQFGSISAYDIKDKFNNKGLYAQSDYKLTDKLTVTGGFRYTFDKVDDDDRNVNVSVPTPGTGTFTCQNILAFNNGAITSPLVVESATSARCDLKTHVQSSRPTWLLSTDYKLTDNAMVYAKWARGYRQGSINPNNLGFPTWGPEKVDTYEVGSKTSFGGPMPGVFDLAAFYNDFRDQQLAVNTVIATAYQGIVPPAQLIVNAGKSRIWGLEADASIKPFSGFVVEMAYAYLNTKLQTFSAPPLPVYYSQLTTAAQVGGPLSLSPKNKISVTGTYTLPLPSTLGPISFGATFTHTDANRALSPIASPLLYEIPAVNDLNVNADWRSVYGKPFDLSFFMTNVTNEEHLLFPDGAWGTIGAEGGHPDLPRMFGFRVKVHFGM